MTLWVDKLATMLDENEVKEEVATIIMNAAFVADGHSDEETLQKLYDTVLILIINCGFDVDCGKIVTPAD